MNLRVEGGAPRRPLIQGLAGLAPPKLATSVNGRHQMPFLTTPRTGGREDRNKRSAIS
jgi:hypothetical protein